MTARETLAEAHQHMTPEQIAAHALGLADVIEAYRRVLDSRELAMTAAGAVVPRYVQLFNGLLADAREIQSLFVSHRKVEARRRLAALAATAALPTPDMPAPETYRLKPIPPKLFSPVTSPVVANDNSERADA